MRQSTSASSRALICRQISTSGKGLFPESCIC
jgi:hypothetical protein